ncbi:chemoreceptor glutamine deamidase CheD [Exilibacterium tricleocarpae]|uniref:Probable chemoreceptor glutamine deamidase CheD n=1 Tax=Exilibacterium tricleocarpae TaxID=2591008 RepID=A0A545U3Z9_9GAMM|nr:chemoreceptor glutamine deamidase CheD [Exilibacterium tricleocarpae]TQV84176.1 chemoreceptor glutamine deamidase CheD [Exilibacterium tricleocarpae]
MTLNKHELPQAIKGFEDVSRYWDRQMKVYAAKILPGEFYVSTHGEMIVTVLGSCVSACIRDRVIGIGGMNHFMLPAQGEGTDGWGQSQVSMSLRYGNWAMEYLINTILTNGGRRKNLEVKLFGGGNVLSNMTGVGQRNIDFARHYVKEERLLVDAQDLGDIYPRKVLYFPDTGAVKVKKLRNIHNNTVEKRERAYIESITEKPAQGDVELF